MRAARCSVRALTTFSNWRRSAVMRSFPSYSSVQGSAPARLIEVSRPLESPVLLRVPLENLVEGPTSLEVSTGLESEIPAGTEIVGVSIDGSNIVNIQLNEAFFEALGERRINATAQLVFTGYGLAEDTQGVRFFDAQGDCIERPVGGDLVRIARGCRCDHDVHLAPDTGTRKSLVHAADGEAQRMDEDPDVKGHFNQTRVKWREVEVPG